MRAEKWFIYDQWCSSKHCNNHLKVDTVQGCSMKHPFTPTNEIFCSLKHIKKYIVLKRFFHHRTVVVPENNCNDRIVHSSKKYPAAVQSWAAPGNGNAAWTVLGVLLLSNAEWMKILRAAPLTQFHTKKTLLRLQRDAWLNWPLRFGSRRLQPSTKARGSSQGQLQFSWSTVCFNIGAGMTRARNLHQV